MIAIIPARGGSKGIPGKNIKLLNGKPLIAYTIEAAKKASLIDRVVVTTDSQEIADVAEEYGAEVPFIRPKYLAEDTSRAQDVYIHAVEYMRDQEGVNIDKFVVLLPTAPFRDSLHIDNAIKCFENTNAETLISIRTAEVPASWLLNKLEDGRIENCGFDILNSSGNRQGNPIHYVPNGAIYILDYRLLKERGTYYSENTVGFLMSNRDSVDIDNMDDFEYAEYLMQRKVDEA